MKSKEVLELTKIDRSTLSRLVKKGVILVDKKLPNGQYIYNQKSIFKYVGLESERYNVIYGRVSTRKQREDLERQIEILNNFCNSNGFRITKIYKDISSGISFSSREALLNLMDDVLAFKVDKVFITYKDRLTRVGFDFFKTLFNKYGTEIVILNDFFNEKTDQAEIFEEIINFLHCFSMKFYSSRKIKKIDEVLSE